jgi:hypothetical protein
MSAPSEPSESSEQSSGTDASGASGAEERRAERQGDESEREGAYEQARHGFDALRLEERAAFLVEATVSTLAEGLDAAGRALARELNRSARHRGAAHPEEGPDGNDADKTSPEADTEAGRGERDVPENGASDDEDADNKSNGRTPR